jgi:amidase
MGGLVCELAVTRTVRDTALLLDAVAGNVPGDPYTAPPPHRPYVDEVGADAGRLRIGVQTAAFGGAVPTHPDCVAAANTAASLLVSLGHAVEPAHVTALDDPEFLEAFLVVWACGAAYELDHYWPKRIERPIEQDDVEPLTWALAEVGRGSDGAAFLAARETLQAISRGVADWFDAGFDLLLTPTLAEPPPLLGEFDSPPDNPLHGLFRAASVVPFTPAFNVSGQPAISLPVHWNSDGLPIGVQLVAPLGREDVLLRVAAQLEGPVAWVERRPPVSL